MALPITYSSPNKEKVSSSNISSETTPLISYTKPQEHLKSLSGISTQRTPLIAYSHPNKPHKSGHPYLGDLSREEALQYALKMGMTDSYRGITQMSAKAKNNTSLLDELKKKDQKLRQIFEHPEYGDSAFGYYMTGAIALDPIGWIPLAGWYKKSKSLSAATGYGVGLGGVYGATSYVGEGESRLLNTALGATGGGVLGLGGGMLSRALSKAAGKNPNIKSLADIQAKNIADEALRTQQKKSLTPKELEKARADLTEALQEAHKGGSELTNNIKSFYSEMGDGPIWDFAVQNWGSGLVGIASGVAGYNAYNDPDSTNAQKIIAGILFTLGGVAGTKGLAKMPWGNKSLGEVISQGIVDNYGLPKKLIKHKKEALGEVNSLATQFENIVLKTLTLSHKDRKVLNAMITGEVDKIDDALVGFSDEAARIIKETGQEMVDAGLLSQKVFQKNANYLHRTYESSLTKDIKRLGFAGARKLKIIGDELRPRGKTLDKSITIKAYERSFKPESKTYGRYDDYTTEALTRAVSKLSYNNLIDKLDKKTKANRKFKLEDYKLNNSVRDVRDWKVIDQDSEKILLESKTRLSLRKDYSKEDRIRMGEIEDASFNISETGRLMTNDLAVFKLYSKIAKDKDLSMGEITFKTKAKKGNFFEEDWIRMPNDALTDAYVGGLPVRKYGELANRYVPKEVHDDLVKMRNMKTEEGKIQEGYLALNRWWKKSKTAWNPVVHANNSISNIILYDLAGADYKYLRLGFKEIKQGIRKEPNTHFYNLAKEHGVFDVDMVSQELRKLGDQIGDDLLLKLSNKTAPEIINAQQYSLGVFQKLGRKGYNLTFKKLEDFYQLEDQAFRMGLFMDRLAKGMKPSDAAADAKKWFIDYDINAPFINIMRRYPTPFLSYTYRVIPLLAEAAIKRPWKFAKWSVGAYALNQVGRATSPGDEDKERILMREDLNQQLFGMPFLPSSLIKLPFSSERLSRTGEQIPLYIDVKRFIPGGDVFSVGDKGIKIPIWEGRDLSLPASLNFNFGALGEILLPYLTHTDPFTMQKIKGLGLGNDGKVLAQHVMSRLTPNIPATAFTIPFFRALDKNVKIGKFEEGNTYLDKAEKASWPFSQSYGSKKVITAFRRATKGIESKLGTTFTPFESIMSVFGFKLQPAEMSQLLRIRNQDFKRAYKNIRTEYYRVNYDYTQGKISKEEAEEKINKLYYLLDREKSFYQADEEELRKPDTRESNVTGGLIKGPYVPNAKEYPELRSNKLTQEPFAQPRLPLSNGGYAGKQLAKIQEELGLYKSMEHDEMIAGMIDLPTPLEQEIQNIQLQAEQSLPVDNLYQGIRKAMNQGGESLANFEEALAAEETRLDNEAQRLLIEYAAQGKTNRGLDNKNFGNLYAGSFDKDKQKIIYNPNVIAYHGVTGIDSEGAGEGSPEVYPKFGKWVHGLRAMAHTLRKPQYRNKTLEEITNTYSRTDKDSYSSNVASLSGNVLKIGEPVDTHNDETLRLLMKSMVTNEVGHGMSPNNLLIDEAIRLSKDSMEDSELYKKMYPKVDLTKPLPPL